MSIIAMQRIILSFFIVLMSCSPNSTEDFRCEGETLTWKLVQELQKIETKDQLPRALPAIKKHFMSIAKLAVEAEKFHSKQPDATHEGPTKASWALHAELERIYGFDNGRTIIEEAARPALLLLQKPKQSQQTRPQNPR